MNYYQKGKAKPAAILAPLAYTRYKLVSQDYTTHNQTLWRNASGHWLAVTATGSGKELCSDGVVHWYDHPVLAVLANPVHADIKNPRLLVVRVSKPVVHDGLKGASKRAKPIREITLPSLTAHQKVEFAIRVAVEVVRLAKLSIPTWSAWAERWLSGSDRTRDATATAATAAADASAAYAADAYAADAATAATAAGYAATAAAYAADADASAAYAADAVAYAANAAAYAAAAAAAYAANAAAYAAANYKIFVRVLKSMKLETV